jgi:8-oxo-dGTP diphosphatase
VAALQRIDVAQALIERDRRMLVVHTVNPAHVNVDRWGLPGGAREPGETLAEAAARETREETGLEIEVGELLALGEWLHRTHDLFAVFRARADGTRVRGLARWLWNAGGSLLPRRRC